MYTELSKFYFTYLCRQLVLRHASIIVNIIPITDFDNSEGNCSQNLIKQTFLFWSKYKLQTCHFKIASWWQQLTKRNILTIIWNNFNNSRRRASQEEIIYVVLLLHRSKLVVKNTKNVPIILATIRVHRFRNDFLRFSKNRIKKFDAVIWYARTGACPDVLKKSPKNP